MGGAMSSLTRNLMTADDCHFKTPFRERDVLGYRDIKGEKENCQKGIQKGNPKKEIIVP
jgi:hypothetical protein